MYNLRDKVFFLIMLCSMSLTSSGQLKEVLNQIGLKNIELKSLLNDVYETNNLQEDKSNYRPDRVSYFNKVKYGNHEIEIKYKFYIGSENPLAEFFFNIPIVNFNSFYKLLVKKFGPPTTEILSTSYWL